MTVVNGVDVYSWNPGRIRVPMLGMRFGPRLGNFGDLLGPNIVAGILNSSPQGSRKPRWAEASGATLFAVGSVLHFAKPGDVIWGAGINGKTDDDFPYPNSLDVRALRGPKSKASLLAAGVEVGDVPFGDPGLLAPTHYGITRAQTPTMSVGIVPNFNERHLYRRHPDFIDPLGPPGSVIKRIAGCEVVVGSSLHGQVIADALGIPCWPTRTSQEPPFKYQDYYLGLGIESVAPAADVDSARKNALASFRQDGSRVSGWSSEGLLKAFPYDLWEGK